MSKQAYHTGTIEIMPHTEHGEFCIVGVFAMNTELRELRYKILGKQKTKRLTGFFPEMEREVFTQTLKSIHDEWDGLANMVNNGVSTQEFSIMQDVAGSDLITAITYPREGMIRHKVRGVVLTDNVNEWLKTAFTKMVMRRDLIVAIPEEQKLTKHVENYLKELNIKKQWKESRVGDENYYAHFPFTYTPPHADKVERAIKPLYLGQETSTKILDHGDTWLQKVRRLNQFKMTPKTLIFPVERPANENSEQYAHAEIVIKDLVQEGVHIVEFSQLHRMKPVLLTDTVSDTPLFARNV